MNSHYSMQRGETVGALADLNWRHTLAKIQTHKWDGYNFSHSPSITDPLYQEPFSNYGPDTVAHGMSAVMATTPSAKTSPNFETGLETYICDEVSPSWIRVISKNTQKKSVLIK